MKALAEIIVGLSVVGAWCYVALTLPDPARAATAPATAQAASKDGEMAKAKIDRVIVQR